MKACEVGAWGGWDRQGKKLKQEGRNQKSFALPYPLLHVGMKRPIWTFSLCCGAARSLDDSMWPQ